MESFLKNRKQKLKINKVSDNLEFNQGIPQGNILGPLLFLIYIDDIPEVVGECSVHLFADDTLIYTLCNDYTKLLVTIKKH